MLAYSITCSVKYNYMQPSLQTQLAQGMMGNSPMNIQSPSAPTYQPGLTTPLPPPMPDKSPASNFTPTQMQQQPPQGMPQDMVTLPIQDGDQQTPGVQVPETEAELILKALTHRQKSISKVQEMAAAHMFPQPMQPQEGV